MFVIVFIIDIFFNAAVIEDKDSLKYLGNLLVILQLIFMLGHFIIQIIQKCN